MTITEQVRELELKAARADHWESLQAVQRHIRSLTGQIGTARQFGYGDEQTIRKELADARAERDALKKELGL